MNLRICMCVCVCIYIYVLIDAYVLSVNLRIKLIHKVTWRN